jgi:hypothetical protein
MKKAIIIIKTNEEATAEDLKDIVDLFRWFPIDKARATARLTNIINLDILKIDDNKNYFDVDTDDKDIINAFDTFFTSENKILAINQNIQYKLLSNEFVGAHRSNCCLIHGCKYGEFGCPVQNKFINQIDSCENCY